MGGKGQWWPKGWRSKLVTGSPVQLAWESEKSSACPSINTTNCSSGATQCLVDQTWEYVLNCVNVTKGALQKRGFLSETSLNNNVF